jgi:hypothetical protein
MADNRLELVVRNRSRSFRHSSENNSGTSLASNSSNAESLFGRCLLSTNVTPLHAAAANGHADCVALLLMERKGRGVCVLASSRILFFGFPTALSL